MIKGYKYERERIYSPNSVRLVFHSLYRVIAIVIVVVVVVVVVSVNVIIRHSETSIFDDQCMQIDNWMDRQTLL